MLILGEWIIFFSFLHQKPSDVDVNLVEEVSSVTAGGWLDVVMSDEVKGPDEHAQMEQIESVVEELKTG